MWKTYILLVGYEYFGLVEERDRETETRGKWTGVVGCRSVVC